LSAARKQEELHVAIIFAAAAPFLRRKKGDRRQPFNPFARHHMAPLSNNNNALSVSESKAAREIHIYCRYFPHVCQIFPSC